MMGEARRRGLLETIRRTRTLTLQERVERDYAGFLAWLQEEKGVKDPFYLFSRDTWDFVIWNNAWNEYQTALKRKAEERTRSAAILELIKQPGPLRAGVVGALLAWPQEYRDQLVAVLQAPSTDPDAPKPGTVIIHEPGWKPDWVAPEDLPDPDLGDAEASDPA